MRSSTEEAILLLTKWKEERTDIDFLFSGASGVGFLFGGRLLEPPSCDDLLGVDEKVDVTLSASLRGASFDFFDTREARPETREFVESKVARGLLIVFANGDKLTLFERKTEGTS